MSPRTEVKSAPTMSSEPKDELTHDQIMEGPDIKISMATAARMRLLILHQYAQRKGAIHFKEMPYVNAFVDTIETAMNEYSSEILEARQKKVMASMDKTPSDTNIALPAVTEEEEKTIES